MSNDEYDYVSEQLQEHRYKSVPKPLPLVPSFGSPGPKRLFFYTLGLRTAISAGLPASSAFEVMGESVQHRSLKRASYRISKELASGVPLEKSLRKRKNIFSLFFVNVFISGLRSGSFERCLDIMVDHFRWLLELRTEILKVVWYPMINMVLGCMIMAARDSIIAGADDFLSIMEILWFYIKYPTISIFTAFLFSRVIKDTRLRPFTDNIISHIPLIGKLYRQYALAIFFRLFGTAVESGRNVPDGYIDAADSMNNFYLAKKLKKWVHFIESGMSLHDTFEQAGVFDNHALGMILAGEESGTVDDVCERMAAYYRQRVKTVAPAIIKSFYPFFIITVALAFFLHVHFFFIGVFSMSLILFLVI